MLAFCIACVVLIAYLGFRLWTIRVMVDDSEFNATFDALAAERDEAAKVKARALAHERAMLAADAGVIAKYGRQHGPVEL